MIAGIYQLTDLEKCPFCGCDTFYVIYHAEGTLKYRIRPDGSDAKNDDLYDTLLLTGGKRVYCDGCNKYLGDKAINKLSTPALLELCNNEQKC